MDSGPHAVCSTTAARWGSQTRSCGSWATAPNGSADRYKRAQVMQWQFFEQYDHEPNLAVARFWELADIHPSRYRDREAKREGGERALPAMERHLAEHGSSSASATRSPTSPLA